MRAWIILAALFLFTGCAEFSALKNAVGSYGAGAADEAVDVAVWQLCNAASIGAIERKFQAQEQKDARVIICAIP